MKLFRYNLDFLSFFSQKKECILSDSNYLTNFSKIPLKDSIKYIVIVYSKIFVSLKFYKILNFLNLKLILLCEI